MSVRASRSKITARSGLLIPTGEAESHQNRPARQVVSCVVGMQLGWPTSQPFNLPHLGDRRCQLLLPLENASSKVVHMTSGSPPVRLVLVDDHEMVIEGLKAMLASFRERVEVVGQAIGVVEALNPDIVLSDVRMQGSSGLDLCVELRERDPNRKIVMLSVYDDE